MHRIAVCALLPSAAALVLNGPAPIAVNGHAQQHSRAASFSMVQASPPKSEEEKASFDTSIDEIPKCPETVWDEKNINFVSELRPAASDRMLPLEIRFDAASEMSEKEFLASKREELLEQLTANGAIWLRGFELMKCASR